MIKGYQVYYFKEGKLKGSGELHLTLESTLIPVELKDSVVKLIEENGNTVLRESVIKKWFAEQGLTLGHS